MAGSSGEADITQLESESERAGEDYTAAGLEPGRKRRVCKPWTSVEQANLQIGIYLFGRQWKLVARLTSKAS